MKRSERYRTISSQQRYGEDLPETVLHFDQTSRTVTLGESKEQEEEKRLADAIVEFLEAKQNPTEERDIHAGVEGRAATKKRALRRLLEEEKLHRQKKFPDKEGTRGNPFLYALDKCWFASSQDIYGNQGTSNEKATLTPQENLPFAGSLEFPGSDESTQSREQESCRFCGKSTCDLTPWGWLCKLSVEDRQRWEERQGTNDAEVL